MRFASTVLFILLASGVCDVSAQRNRGRSARQPPPKPSPAPSNIQPPATTPQIATSTPVAPTLLATVNGQNITTADLEPQVRQEVESLPVRIAEAQRTILEMEINTLLLESEAKRRRVTSQQLYDTEVAKKISAPTAAEIEDFIAKNRDQIGNSDPATVREEVSTFLRGERETKLSDALVAKLRLTHKVVNGADINSPNLAPTAVLATVGGMPITAARVKERLKPIVYKLRLNSYLIQKPALDVTINDILLLAEANRRNVGPEEIVRKEVSDKVQAPTEAEIAAFYEEHKARINGDLASTRNMIANYLQDQNRQKLETALSGRLRKGADIKVLLAEPQPPVQSISVDDDPARGGATAAVTIVMFTDFECPSCASMHPVVDEVMKSYGNNVRLVVRDFPLSRHPNARKAAEAANAAHAQGKFFEYAELLFKRQKDLGIASLKKYATEIGLNRARFDADLDSGKYAAEIRHDMTDGEMYGVDSTPTLFVNGVPLNALNAEALRAAIDRALGSRAAPKATTVSQ